MRKLWILLACVLSFVTVVTVADVSPVSASLGGCTSWTNGTAYRGAHCTTSAPGGTYPLNQVRAWQWYCHNNGSHVKVYGGWVGLTGYSYAWWPDNQWWMCQQGDIGGYQLR